MKAYALQLNNEDLDLQIEPIRNELGQIVQGMTVGNTLYQNQALLISFHPGALREYPTVGVGLGDALLEDDLLRYRHQIRRQLTADGMTVHRLDFYQIDQLHIEADYAN